MNQVMKGFNRRRQYSRFVCILYINIQKIKIFIMSCGAVDKSGYFVSSLVMTVCITSHAVVNNNGDHHSELF